MRVKKNALDIVSDTVCIVSLCGVFIYLAVKLNGFPDFIPTGFDALGKATGYINKTSLICIALIALILYLYLTYTASNKNILNFFLNINETNREPLLNILRDMTDLFKLLLVVSLTFYTIDSSLSSPIPLFYLHIYMILSLIPMIYLFIKFRKLKTNKKQ